MIIEKVVVKVLSHHIEESEEVILELTQEKTHINAKVLSKVSVKWTCSSIEGSSKPSIRL